MYQERTFIDDLKHQFKNGEMTTKLIFINVAVFLFIQLIYVVERLFNFSTDFAQLFFTLETQLGLFIFKPWGLITSIFAHFGLIHFLMNMFFLYFSGKMFEQLFNGRTLLHTYVLGGIFGGILEILAHLLFPALQNEHRVIVGASGSVMAVFSALAFYRPNLKVNLFGVFPIRIIFLAGFFILTDIIALGTNDGTAHFAHIGGVILGFLSIQNLYQSNNIIQMSMQFSDKIGKGISPLFKKRSKLKVSHKNTTRSAQFKSDEQFNLEKKQRQEKIDVILDKISKSGYESLTKAEKDFLFQQSNND